MKACFINIARLKLIHFVIYWHVVQISKHLSSISVNSLLFLAVKLVPNQNSRYLLCESVVVTLFNPVG